MARKLDAAQAARNKSRAKKKVARDDLAVLFPDGTLTLAGCKVTVREYRFKEGLRLQAAMAPLAARIAEICMGRELPLEQVNAAFTEYPELVTQLIATSCDQSEEWVSNLSAREGDVLFRVWWQVNQDFFLRCVVQKVGMTLAQRASAGSESSPPSSPTATPAKTSTQIVTPSIN
jgi:hypothetical protein